jgi:membrane protein involved in colicin uptake
MAEQIDSISFAKRQHCAIEFCVRLGKSGSETLQLIHQVYGDDVMRRAAVFKVIKRSKPPVPPSSRSLGQSAARFREVGGAL